MGINQLNRLINRVDESFNLKRPIPIKEFNGHSIAVDFSILLHKRHSIIHNELLNYYNPLEEDSDEIFEKLLTKRTVKDILNVISRDFISHGIKPIIVIDGESPELKKIHTAPKRSKGRKDALEKINILKNSGEDDIFEELVSLKSQTRKISSETYKLVIKSLKDKYYPVLKATNEAEELCTKLCLEGLVKAVYSTDTDNIVRKCPLLITNFSWDENAGMMAHTVSYNPIIHESIGLNYSEFVDYCIMMGCDYNKRIDRMFEWDIIEYLFLYQSIENVEKETGLNMISLNYQESRKLLTNRSIKECCVSLKKMSRYFPQYELSEESE